MSSSVALQPWLEYFGAGYINAGVYDGDTMPAERSRIRKSANIILTNLEMLNTAFLVNHSNYGFDFIFTNLKYVIIDELHSYRGAFGSHLANIFRRLTRVCRYYKSSPQFLCSSATIANPLELAENICGRSFTLISKDGSPAPAKEFWIVQPPVIKGDSKKIAGYRGGYTPLERKEIEQKMITGEFLGLISTNALELGIDIGSLDTTVIVGYPGTRASFWQQTGRAGRGKEACVNYLLLENLPFDQYIAIDPDWLFQQG